MQQPQLTTTPALVFKRPDRGKLKLTSAVVQQCLSFVQDDPSKDEAGGVLLGRRILNAPDIVVDQVTLPADKDRRSLFSFFRSQKPHQRVIEEVWHQSNRTCNYLGEWHTHPEPDPHPSCVDRRSWRRALKKTKFDGEELFFVIVGTSTIRVWEGERSTRKIVQLAEEKR